MKKFLKPKRSRLAILGVGQMISEQDLLKASPSFEDSKVPKVPQGSNETGVIKMPKVLYVSSVSVVCNSLKGSVYYLKAHEFLKVMRRDATTWEIFETHWKRKFGEAESRMALMNNVLEKNSEEEKYIIDFHSLFINSKERTRTASRPK